MRIIPDGGKPSLRYILVSVASGILFGALDGVINANPYAQRLYSVYQPIARTSINVAAGIGIDLAYGFILSTIFLLLYSALPGRAGILKGLNFAVLIWFMRVVMSAASTWMMFTVPIKAINYSILTGLLEMLVLGVLYGSTLRPKGVTYEAGIKQTGIPENLGAGRGGGQSD